MLVIATRYTEWPITSKHSVIDICNGIYETYILELRYRWPKAKSILRPLHSKSMGKNERRLFWTKTIRNTLKDYITGRPWDGILWLVTTRHVTARSFQVMKDHQQFFGNNFWLRPARAMKTPHMCSGRRWKSTDIQHDLFGSGHDLDLRWNFHLLRSN